MDDKLVFFRTSMPNSRPADYCIGCHGGSVFIDFESGADESIRISRISFDGYGCCDLVNPEPMDEENSKTFLLVVGEQPFEAVFESLTGIEEIIKSNIRQNRHLLWVDALREYKLI